MKLPFIVLGLLLATLLHAQKADHPAAVVPDQRLYEVYSADYIDQLLIQNPFLIKRWNYYLDHAFTIVDAVAGKTDQYPEVVIEDIHHVNILLLEKEQGLTHAYDIPVIYNIKNTNQCLVYQPGKKFAKAFRQMLSTMDN